jgi:hypothetical protein
MSESIKFLLWSNKHSKWWKASAAGYTDDVAQAGRYLLGDALVIVTKAAYHGRVDQATVMIAEPAELAGGGC